MSEIPLPGDIVVLLEHDHEALRHFLTGFHEVPRADWRAKRDELTNRLVRHEVAEERVLYPAARQDFLSGNAVVSDLLAQEAEAESHLASLEKLDPEDEQFALVLDHLQSAVLIHMRDEQTKLFPFFRDLDDEVRRVELGEQYLRIMAIAPTHPHPHAPNAAPGNVVVGPVTGLIDRIRDAVRDATD